MGVGMRHRTIFLAFCNTASVGGEANRTWRCTNMAERRRGRKRKEKEKNQVAVPLALKVT